MFEPSARGERMVWSVGALIHAVGDALAARFAACAVRGELSGFSRAPSGHCYFSLKDPSGEGGLIRCAMFRRAASLLDFLPADGAEVELRGRLTVYEPRGELQFVVESMRRSGAGTLFEQFLRLKARLEAEGLFEFDRKRPLPRFPARIGVVTSLGAAALHDVLTSLARRAPHVGVVVYPTLVQGRDAPASIASALALAASRREVDLLIVCRGGGSLEDLWAFNDEVTVRAVAASPIPTVSGVGHETDLTLVDFAADLRAATPTAAAELATPSLQDSLALLEGIAARLSRRVRHALDMNAQRLDNHGLRLTRPSDVLRRRERALLGLGQRMMTAAHAFARRRESPLTTPRSACATRPRPSWRVRRIGSTPWPAAFRPSTRIGCCAAAMRGSNRTTDARCSPSCRWRRETRCDWCWWTAKPTCVSRHATCRVTQRRVAVACGDDGNGICS